MAVLRSASALALAAASFWARRFRPNIMPPVALSTKLPREERANGPNG